MVEEEINVIDDKSTNARRISEIIIIE